jgi:hypothetical protein
LLGAAVAFAFAAMVGCNGILGIEEAQLVGGGGSSGGTAGTGGGGNSPYCAPEARDTVCTSCLKAQCCRDLAGCFDNADCNALVECLWSCADGDSACETSCMEKHSVGMALLATLASCSALNCSTSCGGDDVIVPDCTPPSFDPQLVESCVLRVSCDPLVAGFTVSQCIAEDRQATALFGDCTGRATSCSEVNTCLHRGYVTSDECAGFELGDNWHCADGSRAVRCVSEIGYYVDCGAYNATCLGHTSSVDPNQWACVAPAVVSCEGELDTSFSCSDTVHYRCLEGYPFGVDCGAIGMQCIVGRPGDTWCGQQSPSCASPNTEWCDGTRRQVCNSYGLLETYDCGVAGLTCTTDPVTLSAACVPAGCPVTPCVEGCAADGFTMQLCPGGMPLSVSCRDYEGFDTCFTYDMGTPDKPVYVASCY